MNKTNLVGILLVIIAFFCFIFKFLEVPPGLEVDETSIMYSASLVSDTGRDQLGRPHIVFFISDNRDWKQPFLVYLTAVAFKVFGKSLTVAKLVNIVLMSVSVWFVWKILLNFFGQKLSFAGTLMYILMPILMHTVRIANEAVLPIFFGVFWVYFLFQSEKVNTKQRLYYYLLCAITLGLSMYAYKGMRIVAPVWILVNLAWIWQKTSEKKIKNTLLYMAVILPFFLIMPKLEKDYPGAVFDNSAVLIKNYRQIAYYWLENLSPSFLFVRSGVGKVFQVEEFGNYLISTLPFFLVGVWVAIKRRGLLLWLLGIFVLTPALFFLATSSGYGHRVGGSAVAYVVLMTAGIDYLFKQKGLRIRLLSGVLVVLCVLNQVHFLQYYFTVYPRLHQVREAFGLDLYWSYKKFGTISKEHPGYKLYIEKKLRGQGNEFNKFLERVYLEDTLNSWIPGAEIQSKSLLLTEIGDISGTKTLWKDNKTKSVILLKD